MKTYLAFIVLLNALTSLSQGPQFDWFGVAKCNNNWNSVNPSEYSSIDFDSENKIYLTGTFNSDTYFDFNSNTNYLSPNMSYWNPWEYNTNVFIQKVDSIGNFIWAKSFGNYYTTSPNAIKLDQENNIYIIGEFRDTVDFDPGVLEFEVIGDFTKNSYILKLNSDGEFLWVKTFDGTSANEALGLTISNTNELIIGGVFAETLDFDPNSGVSSAVSNGMNDGFILCLDSDGNFKWKQTVGGTDNDLIQQVTLDNSGNIAVAGLFKESFDINPESGTQMVTSNGLNDCFIEKFDSTGNWIFGKTFGGEFDDNISSLVTNSSNAILISGIFKSSVDFDPDLNIALKASLGSSDIFLLKLNDQGIFEWVKTIEHTYFNDLPYITTNQTNGIFMMSKTNPYELIDYNPNEESFYFNKLYNQTNGPEFFVLKLNDDGQFLNVNALQGNFGQQEHLRLNGLSFDNNRMFFFGSIQETMDMNLGNYITTSNEYQISDSPLITAHTDNDEVFIYQNECVENWENDTINIHSIDAGRQTSGDNGYTLNGTHMLDSRSKLLNPGLFGDSGIYSKSIVIDEDYASSGSLNNVTELPHNDIFFFGSFDKNHPSINDFTQSEIDSLYEWSLRGGKLLIGSSGTFYGNGTFYDSDILNQKWGFSHYTTNAFFKPTELGQKTDLFNDGPFGTLSWANQAGGLKGYFHSLPEDIQVYATDFEGNPTLYMDCNSLDLVIADIDAYTSVDNNISSGNEVQFAQDQFLLNTIVFMDKLQQLPVVTNDNGTLKLNQQYTNYEWYLNDELTSVESQYTPSQHGEYYSIVTFNGGCKKRSPSIMLNQLLNTEELFNSKNPLISIYPNPYDENFTVEFLHGDSFEKEVQILDCTGKILYSTTTYEKSTLINLKHLQDGTYFVKVRSNGNTETRKLIHY